MRMLALGLALALSAHATVRADVVAVPMWLDLGRIETIPAETTIDGDASRAVMAALRRRFENEREAIETCSEFSWSDPDRQATIRMTFDASARASGVHVVSSTFTRRQQGCIVASLRRLTIPAPAGRVTLLVHVRRQP